MEVGERHGSSSGGGGLGDGCGMQDGGGMMGDGMMMVVGEREEGG